MKFHICFVLIASFVLLDKVCGGDDTDKVAKAKTPGQETSTNCAGAQGSRDLGSYSPGKMCPIYLYGQWNGVFYYYGRMCPDTAPCSTVGASSMVLHSMDGPCAPCPNAGTCPDPITGIPTFFKDGESETPEHEPEAGVMIPDFVPSKNTPKPGDVEPTDPKLIKWRRSKFWLAGSYARVAYDEEAYVDIDDIRHVFRVIEVALDVQPAEHGPVRHVLRVGQELSRHGITNVSAKVGRLSAQTVSPADAQDRKIIQIKILDEPLKDRYFTVFKKS